MQDKKNTYKKYCPHVFLAQCTEKHDKGSVIEVVTRYGKVNPSIVFNLIYEKGGYYYYSIVRQDGFNTQEWAKRKAERLQNRSDSALQRAEAHDNRISKQEKEFLSLGEPIKIGHHSEQRHRKLIEKSWEAQRKRFEELDKAENLAQRAEYWEARKNEINLSMPESIYYYKHRLKEAQLEHSGLKDGTIERDHS